MVGIEQDTAAARRPIAVWLAWTCLTLTMLFWAASSVAGRMAAGNVPPSTLSFWRWAIAFLCFLPFCGPQLLAHRRVIAREWRILFLLSFLGIVGFTLPYYFGLQYTTAVNGSLLNAASPILIVLITLFWFGTRVTKRQIIGVALGVIGTAAIVVQGDISVFWTLEFNVGDLLVLLAIMSWSAYTPVLRWAPREFDSLSFMCLLSGLSLVMFAPFYIYDLVQGRYFDFTTKNVAIILFSAIFPSLLAYVFWNIGVAAIGPNQAGFSQYLVPAFGVILANATLSETIQTYHAVGIAAIFVGVALATARARRSG